MHNLHTNAEANFKDEEIISHVLAGNKDLFALIIKKYNARLYRVAVAILDNDHEAEDAMQAAYINTYENLGQYAGRSSFATWLTRILVNECLHRIRIKKKAGITSENFLENENKKISATLEKTPSDKMINNELKSILECSIRGLPEKYRCVFVMREIEGLSTAETQECLDLSEANVKVRLNRAKVLLKEKLSEYYRKEDIFHFHLTRCDRMVSQVMSKIL